MKMVSVQPKRVVDIRSKRMPKRRSAARAMPDGGHADETTGWTADAMKPSLPARK